MAAEPRVLTEDVSRILTRVVQPDDPDYGEAVQQLAERAETSTRTVYRILGRETYTVTLALADRLVMAAGEHLDSCRLVTPDNRVVGYRDA